MTGCTVFDDPSTRPVSQALAVGSAHPVFFLSEMALAAQLVAVIHVDPGSLFNHEEIALVFFMAGKTVKGFLLPTVHQGNVAMGHFCSLRNFDFLVVVTLAALEALNFILTGPGPETSALVPGLHQYGIRRQRLDRTDTLVVKWGGCLLIGFGNSSRTRVDRHP